MYFADTTRHRSAFALFCTAFLGAYLQGLQERYRLAAWFVCKEEQEQQPEPSQQARWTGIARSPVTGKMMEVDLGTVRRGLSLEEAFTQARAGEGRLPTATELRAMVECAPGMFAEGRRKTAWLSATGSPFSNQRTGATLAIVTAPGKRADRVWSDQVPEGTPFGVIRVRDQEPA